MLSEDNKISFLHDAKKQCFRSYSERLELIFFFAVIQKPVQTFRIFLIKKQTRHQNLLTINKALKMAKTLFVIIVQTLPAKRHQL